MMKKITKEEIKPLNKKLEQGWKIKLMKGRCLPFVVKNKFYSNRENV